MLSFSFLFVFALSGGLRDVEDAVPYEGRRAAEVVGPYKAKPWGGDAICVRRNSLHAAAALTRDGFVSAPSFFLSKSNPLCWASIWF